MDRKSLINSFLWKLLERSGAQGIQFVISIILARLLLPEMYGTLAIIMVFINLAQALVNGGLSVALIQKKEVDGEDYSTVLSVSMLMAIVMFLLLFFFAPAIADYYNDSQLISVLRVLGSSLFLGAVNGVQNAHISRNLMFKLLFSRSLISLFISGTAGIISAYLGLGIWALVIQQLTNQMIITALLWFNFKWNWPFRFSIDRFRSLFGFGYRVLLSTLIDTLYRELHTLIIGRTYSFSVLGYYNKGEQFPKLIMSSIDGSLQAVLFPALSARQDSKPELKAMTRRTIMTSSFILFPTMIGLAVVAEPMIKTLLTHKWLPVVPFLRIFCVSYSLWPIHTANLQAINAVGRSDIFLKIELIKKTIGIMTLLITVPLGAYAMAIGGAVCSILFTLINAFPNTKLLHYGIAEQSLDILPSLAIALTMGLLISFIRFMGLGDLATLILQVTAGMVFYGVITSLCKLDSYQYISSIIKNLFKR